jgi:hypothetical protein
VIISKLAAELPPAQHAVSRVREVPIGVKVAASTTSYNPLTFTPPGAGGATFDADGAEPFGFTTIAKRS